MDGFWGRNFFLIYITLDERSGRNTIPTYLATYIAFLQLFLYRKRDDRSWKSPKHSIPETEPNGAHG